MGMALKVALALLAVGVGAQVMMVDYSAPVAEGPIVAMGEAGEIMASACNDCHTNQTEWPWYSKVPPVSFWLADHVEEGREHFNMSSFGAYSPREADHKLEEMIEMIEDGEMPLRSYKWGHPEARLTYAQREVLVAWARAERERIDYQPENAEAVTEPVPDQIDTTSQATESAG